MNRSQTTLLVIDDEPIVLRKISKILELEGFIVHSASSGHEGIEKVRSVKPNLILCDVTMGEVDGHAVLRSLRDDATTAAIPFIFLTARGQPQVLRTGMNLGADDYLVKPVDMHSLLRAIDARMERVRQLAGPAAQSFAIAFKSARPLEALGLSVREAEVLFWVAQGKSNYDVGTILGISEHTAKKHLSNIFDQCGFENRTAASMRAVEMLGATGG